MRPLKTPTTAPPLANSPKMLRSELRWIWGLLVGMLALQGVSVKSVVQKGLRDQARLVMVVHPVLESRFGVAMNLIAGLDIMRAPPRAIRVIEEEFG